MQNWIAICIGKMHINKITQEVLADKLGIRRDYLNKILNGKEHPKGAKKRITTALDELIKEKQ